MSSRRLPTDHTRDQQAFAQRMQRAQIDAASRIVADKASPEPLVREAMAYLEHASDREVDMSPYAGRMPIWHIAALRTCLRAVGHPDDRDPATLAVREALGLPHDLAGLPLSKRS